MFCGLGEEERTKIRKKKKKKKLIAAKSGLVGMKGYLKKFYHMKYFLLSLSRFCLRPLFTPNLRGGFRILKPKSRDLLSRNLVSETFRLNFFSSFEPLNFRAFRDISSQFSDKPSETDIRSMKVRVKVVCTLLTLSK